MKQRILFFEIIKHIEHKNALMVTGMRQVGKTTLLRQVYDHIGTAHPKAWFDLDNPLDQKIFEDSEYRNIYTRLRDACGGKAEERIFVFVDEIQNFPEITRVMKYLIDHYGVKFFVTGSSNFYLRNLFPESLSGRKFLYRLDPLSFGEFLYFHDKVEGEILLAREKRALLAPVDLIEAKARELHYEEYLRYGGYPEVVTTVDRETKKEVLKNIFASFFGKDLRLISDYSDTRELRDLILLLVPRVGSMLDVTKLSVELGVDRPKIYGYLEFLQGVFFLRLLPRFSKSIDRSVAGGRKVYFADTGLFNIIGNVNDAQLFENAVINQLSRYGEVSFFNKRNVAEIDAIVDKETAFEVKLRGTARDIAEVQKRAHTLGLKESRVVTRDIAPGAGYLMGSAIL